MTRPPRQPTILEMPPFPPLTWDGFTWSAGIVLKSWAGGQSRLGPYGSLSSSVPSDGTVGMCVTAPPPPPGETGRKRPPTPQQGAAYQFLLDHESLIHDRVVQAIFADYNDVIPQYLEHGYLDLPASLASPDELHGLIGLSGVHVLDAAMDGVCFVGFGFSCEWDVEHGLGAMTWNGEVVEVGSAEAAFCPPWPDEGDR